MSFSTTASDDGIGGRADALDADTAVVLDDVALDPGAEEKRLFGDVILSLARLHALGAADALVDVDPHSVEGFRPALPILHRRGSWLLGEEPDWYARASAEGKRCVAGTGVYSSVHLRHVRIVTLPAEILLPVRRQFDLRRPFHGGVRAVALRAELARGGLGRPDASRVHLMLLWGDVTGRAFQERVRRDRLGALNLAVACLAFPGNRRGLRIVRLVAGVTRLQRIVGNRVDLREAPRARGVVRMARRTELPIAGRRRLEVDRVLGVVLGGAMTGLTGDVAVEAFLLLRVLRLVTIGTRAGAGVLDLTRRFPLHRCRTLQGGTFQGRREKRQRDSDGGNQQDDDHRESNDSIG